jgi:hypothetical protein
MTAAFASTVLLETPTVFGNKKVVYGTFASSGGATGGDIATGLQVVENIILQHTGSSVSADAPAINETLPCGGDVTIVTTANTAGSWMAIGR